MQESGKEVGKGVCRKVCKKLARLQAGTYKKSSNELRRKNTENYQETMEKV